MTFRQAFLVLKWTLEFFLYKNQRNNYLNDQMCEFNTFVYETKQAQQYGNENIIVNAICDVRVQISKDMLISFKFNKLQ